MMICAHPMGSLEKGFKSQYLNSETSKEKNISKFGGLRGAIKQVKEFPVEAKKKLVSSFASFAKGFANQYLGRITSEQQAKNILEKFPGLEESIQQVKNCNIPSKKCSFLDEIFDRENDSGFKKGFHVFSDSREVWVRKHGSNVAHCSFIKGFMPNAKKVVDTIVFITNKNNEPLKIKEAQAQAQAQAKPKLDNFSNNIGKLNAELHKRFTGLSPLGGGGPVSIMFRVGLDLKMGKVLLSLYEKKEMLKFDSAKIEKSEFDFMLSNSNESNVRNLVTSLRGFVKAQENMEEGMRLLDFRGEKIGYKEQAVIKAFSQKASELLEKEVVPGVRFTQFATPGDHGVPEEVFQSHDVLGVLINFIEKDVMPIFDLKTLPKPLSTEKLAQNYKDQMNPIRQRYNSVNLSSDAVWQKTKAQLNLPNVIIPTSPFEFNMPSKSNGALSRQNSFASSGYASGDVSLNSDDNFTDSAIQSMVEKKYQVDTKDTGMGRYIFGYRDSEL